MSTLKGTEINQLNILKTCDTNTGTCTISTTIKAQSISYEGLDIANSIPTSSGATSLRGIFLKMVCH